MSNEFLQTADAARRLLAGFSAVAEVAKAFEDVGRLEQRKAELEPAVLGLKAEHDNLTQDLADARAAIDAAKLEASSVRINADAEAARVMADARAAAARLADESEEQRRLALAEHDRAVVAQGEELQALRGQRDTLAQELSDLESKIERARAKMAEILGA